MRKILILVPVFLIVLIGCKNREKEIKSESVKLDFNLDKVVIVNLNEVCITYFKIKINNPSNSPVILLDNSLTEYFSLKLKATKTGFYLKNKENDSIIPLGIDNYNFIEVKPKSNNFYFIGAKDLNHSFKTKDSLLLKRALSNYVLEYNGKKLNLVSIKKSKYISKLDFENFHKRKENYIPYKDSVSIGIPVNILKFKYLNENPIYRDEWNKL
ncbi:hypothetical protein ACHRVW_11635 [Flavobacterium collinsii]|uniref:hypothetical protein n=1 Tax=Flavobacterium collinsii TaxID=1114861 RepID=UPI003756AF22